MAQVPIGIVFHPKAVMAMVVWHAARQALRLGASGGSIGGGSFVQKTLTFLGIPSLFDLADDLYGYSTSELWNGDAALLEQMVEEMEGAVRSGRIRSGAGGTSRAMPNHITVPLESIGSRSPFLFTPRFTRRLGRRPVAGAAPTRAAPRRRRTTT